MQERTINRLRKSTLALRKIPGMVLLLEPFRKFFSTRSECVQVTDFDGSLTMRLRLDEHMQSQIFWYGYYSRDIILVLDRIIKPGMTVLDVGANIGEVSLAAARRVGQAGRVFSFEPAPKLYSRLQEHINLNDLDWVQPIAKGVSDKEGKYPLFAASAPCKDGTSNDGLGTLYPTESKSNFIGNIELMTIDGFVSASGLSNIGLIKIDVEGAELPVIRGGLAAIKNFKPFIIVEIQPDTALSAGYKTHDIVRALETLGYRLSVIGRKGRLRPYANSDYDQFRNVLCIPPGSKIA